MLKWIDIIKFANQGAPPPDRRVEKTADEWRTLLTPGQYQVTREHGTERPFSSGMCGLFQVGSYQCVCCGTPLFDADDKFDSGSGWPSFTQPVRENAVAYRRDRSHGMSRIEALCNTCDAHLGHVFLDGPGPAGLRFCINALALEKIESPLRKATFGGGCFWCTEAIFRSLKGVVQVESGYAGGHVANPTYREVCSGRTGHAEVIQLTYDPQEISYTDLLRVHFGTHNPTLPIPQDTVKGSQYRSLILTRDDDEKKVAEALITDLRSVFDKPILTTIQPFEIFHPAESQHQEYYFRNPGKPYCDNIIEPKLAELRASFRSLLRPEIEQEPKSQNHPDLP